MRGGSEAGEKVSSFCVLGAKSFRVITFFRAGKCTDSSTSLLGLNA